ncbi:transcriptional repressor MprA [Antarctobacter heliothermus]|uniref:Transcriptional repressor MprA n=1 Tax=Antarctobacter heliothermus TaxID=74033 RepID=A0A222E4Q1_9RHOB|nr:MarR family winged helix-turn-helix transcriptional regulator [Antarctobacter heliothermus]ASP21194.1 transcriptional repressor MprA [Antarctobacter heliothermus]
MTTRSDPPPFDLASFTPYRLAVAAEKTSEALARQYRERFGISIPEWRVLVHLAQPLDGAATISVRDIEERVAMEKSKVSRAASRLEAAGYVEKTVDAGDRRLVRLALTDKGRQIMADLLPLAMAYQKKIEATLAESFAGLEAGLDAILDAE